MALDSSQLIETLKTHWRSAGLKLAAGADRQSILEFERAHKARFPPDFQDYLLAINGMRQDSPNDCDKDGFSFWPIQRIKSIPQENPKLRWSSDLPPASRCVIFADYLQWSWAYAIELPNQNGRGGSILSVGVLKPRRICNSFSEFVKLYVENSKLLYPE